MSSHRDDNARVLVDTSAWVEFFKQRTSPVSDRVADLVRADRTVTTGVVLAELLHGARGARERERIIRTLGSLPYWETTREDWLRAGDLLAGLRAHGVTVPLTDAVLAALCLGHDVPILTLDRHFSQVEGLRMNATSSLETPL